MMQNYTVEEPKVRWVDAVGASQAPRHDRWRQAVGAPLIENHAPEFAGVLDELTIVSWNVHVGSADILLFIDHLRSGRLTGGAPVGHFVLLVQEAFRAGGSVPDPMPAGAISARPIFYPDSNGERISADDVARHAGLFVAYAPSMRNGSARNPVTGKCEDRGNAIFGTLPIDDITAVELPMLNQRRVAVLGHVHGETSGGAKVELQLGSIHLDLKATPWGRASQAQAILAAADAPACIVAGDLNTLPVFESTFSVLANAFPNSAFTDVSATHVAAINRRIDFQFCRLADGWHAMPYVRVPNLYNSDHYPLISSVRFVPR